MDELVTNMEEIKTQRDTITPDKLLKGFTVFGITGEIDLDNLVAENIKKGVTINGITGTYEGE